MDGLETRLDKEEAEQVELMERANLLRRLLRAPDSEAPLADWLAFVATKPCEVSVQESGVLKSSSFQLGITEFSEFFKADALSQTSPIAPA